MQMIYPDLYRVDDLNDDNALKEEDDNGGEVVIPQPPRLQLSFEQVSAIGKEPFFASGLMRSGLTKPV